MSYRKRLSPELQKAYKGLNYRQLKGAGIKLHPAGDFDKDKARNVKDCRPLDPKRQDLSKQHFQAIADILSYHGATDAMVQDFADYFATENPRFDRVRFIKAVKGE